MQKIYALQCLSRSRGGSLFVREYKVATAIDSKIALLIIVTRQESVLVKTLIWQSVQDKYT